MINPPSCKNLKAAKVILFPGEDVGEHVTHKREEIIIVLKGKGVLIKKKEKVPMKEGDVHYIKENTRHNVRNTSRKLLEYVYVVNSF